MDAELSVKDDGSQHLLVQISEEDLLCRNGCGYYGTPQWNGLCSQCWRVYQVQEKRQLDYAKNRSLLSFERFEEKRRQVTEKRSFPSILRISPSRGSQVQGTSARPVLQRSFSAESQTAKEKFLEFLQKMPKSVAHEISRQTQHAVDKILANQHIALDDLSEMVQNFYQIMAEKLNKSPIMNDVKAKFSTEEVMQEVEQYLCVRTYSGLFCSKTDEEVADLSLQDRIRSLQWVTAGFLQTSLDFSISKVKERIDEAISEMIEMNSRRGTSEKLDCLVRCSKKIFEAIKDSRPGTPASADEFLPVLIYVMLRGNPPLIQSNLKFISRFALPNRVMSGESGYFFTNLSCALEFVQNMNAESLKMEKDKFEAYTSGNLMPPLTEANCGCNQAIKSMENSVRQTKQLNEQLKQMSLDYDAFIDKTNKETDEMLAEVKAFRESFCSKDWSLPHTSIQ